MVVGKIVDNTWINPEALLAQQVKKSACNAGDAGDTGLIPGLGRSTGGGNGNPLQYSCLENPMNRGVWRATGQGSQRVRQG